MFLVKLMLVLIKSCIHLANCPTVISKWLWYFHYVFWMWMQFSNNYLIPNLCPLKYGTHHYEPSRLTAILKAQNTLLFAVLCGLFNFALANLPSI